MLTTVIIIDKLYTPRWGNFGIAFSQAICVTGKYTGKALLETGF